MEELYAYIHIVLLSFLRGRMLTIFFKKHFSFRAHLADILYDGVVLVVSWAVVPRSAVIASLELLLLLYKCFKSRNDEIVKSLVISFSIYVVMHGTLSEVVFECGTLAIATTQFLRIPQQLSTQLRDVRINFGPVYVISMCSGMRFHPIQNLAWDLPSLTTYFTVTASVLAAVFFRPDNSQTLKIFLGESLIPGTDTRRRIHGYLMLSSFVLTFLKVLNSTSRIVPDFRFYFWFSIFFGVLNMALYLAYKYSRRWN